MRDQEMLGLMEAYASVYAQPEEQEIVSEDSEDLQQKVGAALDAAAKNPVIKAIGSAIAPVGGKGRKTPTATSGGYRPVKDVKEESETDIFDAILEHLVAEGYADTNKAALAIMANMSEEWRQSIVESAIAQRTAAAVDDQRRGSYGMADDLNKTRKSLDKLKPYPNGFPNAAGVKGV